MGSNSNKITDIILELSKFHDFDRLFVLRGWLFRIPIIAKPKQRIFYTIEIHKHTFKLFDESVFIRTLKPEFIGPPEIGIGPSFPYVITTPSETIGNLKLDFFNPSYFGSIPGRYREKMVKHGYETIKL